MEPLSNDPYAPPSVAETEFVSGKVGYVAASQGARFVNFIVDFFVVQGVLVGIGMVVGAMNPHGIHATKAEIELVSQLLSLAVLFLYYLLMETFLGRTVGKFATGTKVIDLEDKRPSFGKVLGRTACRFIPFDAFSFLGGGPGGWHDSIPKTRVVKSKPLPVTVPAVAPRIPGAAPVYRQPLAPVPRPAERE